MNKAVLTRFETSDKGTFGTLQLTRGQAQLTLVTGELPWRHNRRNISCIPTGVYRVQPITSPKFGRVLLVLNVPGRDGILFHVANFFGDREKGHRTDVEGCIGVGFSVSTTEHFKMISDSAAAVATLMAFTKGEAMELTIEEHFV